GFGVRSYSVIHVDDLCVALLAAANTDVQLRPNDPIAGLYTVSDGVEYQLEDLGVTMATLLRRSPPVVLGLPGPVINLAVLGAELVSRLSGTAPILNRDKIRELRCPTWTCANERAVADLGFAPTISLTAGLASAVETDRLH